MTSIDTLLKISSSNAFSLWLTSKVIVEVVDLFAKTAFLGDRDTAGGHGPDGKADAPAQQRSEEGGGEERQAWPKIPRR